MCCVGEAGAYTLSIGALEVGVLGGAVEDLHQEVRRVRVLNGGASGK